MENAKNLTLECLQRLSGTWMGEGTGEYPTIASFHYQELFTFTSAEGKAYLHYEQRTWRMDQSGNKMPSHWETGFWRVISDNEVELLCAQASGRLEAARGALVPTEEGFVLNFQSIQFALDTRVEQSWREFDFNGSTLRYTLKMQTSAVPELALHVQAQLKRTH